MLLGLHLRIRIYVDMTATATTTGLDKVMSADLIRRGEGRNCRSTTFAAVDRIFRLVGKSPLRQHGQISLLMFSHFFYFVFTQTAYSDNNVTLG